MEADDDDTTIYSDAVQDVNGEEQEQGVEEEAKMEEDEEEDNEHGLSEEAAQFLQRVQGMLQDHANDMRNQFDRLEAEHRVQAARAPRRAAPEQERRLGRMMLEYQQQIADAMERLNQNSKHWLLLSFSILFLLLSTHPHAYFSPLTLVAVPLQFNAGNGGPPPL